jgi:hypothetical protein
MELITNGNFESGELSPWTPCAGMTLEGGITDIPDNPVFCSSHNLKLLGDDCVRQQLERAAVASEGTLSLWIRFCPTTYIEYVSAADAGTIEARVEYSAGGDSAVALMNFDALQARGAAMLDPYHLTVAVDPTRYVTAVQLRCYSAAEPWYVAGVSMDGYYVGSGYGAAGGPAKRIDERLTRLERRIMRLDRFLTTTLSHELRPAKSSIPPAKPPKGKKAPARQSLS